MVTREELYKLVWARPMVKVAAEFGVSGTALKKTCNRHKVPTPERGYWAKLEHGKAVQKTLLPKLKNAFLNHVRIAENPRRRLPATFKDAAAKARQRAVLAPQQTQPGQAADDFEHPALAATRRAITKARSDGQGFAAASGRGVAGLKIAPANTHRALDVVGRLLRLAEAQGHGRDVTDKGLVLVVDGESLTFTLEEQTTRTPHEPTPKDLKQKADNLRWGSTSDPWPKYDHFPSGRLAVVINENDYSGLRRTYADGKIRTLEALLPEVLIGLVEHAALKKARRLRAEEERRLSAIRAAQRRREEAFQAREKRREEFIGAIAAQLFERDRLTKVLTHLEATEPEEMHRIMSMAAWVRIRIKQIEALLSPVFLDISARSAEVEYDEAQAAAGPRGDGEHRYYVRSAALQFWSINDQTHMATGQSAYEWAIAAGHLAGERGA